MLNAIWVALVVIGVLVAAVTGRVEAVTSALAASTRGAIDTVLSFVGVMAFWLGLMRVAERSGLQDSLARLLRPLVRGLFRGVPEGHPAFSSILTNISCNLLGLGSAATPVGLKAMRHLQELNPRPGEATDAMCTFLALNTSAVTLIPTTILAIRAATGSSSPADVVGPALLATLASTTVALTADAALRRRAR